MNGEDGNTGVLAQIQKVVVAGHNVSRLGDDGAAQYHLVIWISGHIIPFDAGAEPRGRCR